MRQKVCNIENDVIHNCAKVYKIENDVMQHWHPFVFNREEMNTIRACITTVK